jgi:hypothetical protein
MNSNSTIKKSSFKKLFFAYTLILIFLSGCYDVIYGNYSSFCESEFMLGGPDEIIFAPCEPQEIEYFAFADLNKFDLATYGFEWTVSGEIEIVSNKTSNPLIIKASNNGTGTVTLSGPGGYDDENCAGQGELLTFSKTITIKSVKPLEVTSSVCKYESGLGVGALTVFDELPTTQDYHWTISPAGIADLIPKPGTPYCFIENAQGDFTIAVQKIGSKCVTDPVFFQIQIPDCQQ